MDANMTDLDDEPDVLVPIRKGPVLFSGTFPPASVAELVKYLPPRHITDMLIRRFFMGKEPAWSEYYPVWEYTLNAERADLGDSDDPCPNISL